MLTATLLIVHEIDSAYWKEWELFHLPGGIGFFLLLHLPLVFLILFGAVMIERRTGAGIIMASLLSAAGFVAFFLHSFFLAKGRPEFRSFTSISILAASLISSASQAYFIYKIWALPS